MAPPECRSLRTPALQSPSSNSRLYPSHLLAKESMISFLALTQPQDPVESRTNGSQFMLQPFHFRYSSSSIVAAISSSGSVGQQGIGFRTARSRFSMRKKKSVRYGSFIFQGCRCRTADKVDGYRGDEPECCHGGRGKICGTCCALKCGFKNWGIQNVEVGTEDSNFCC